MGSSRTRARTRVPCIGRRILNHCATREAPFMFFIPAVLRHSSHYYQYFTDEETETKRVQVICPQPPPTSAGDPPTLAGRSGSVSYGVTVPSLWVLMCTLLCVCPLRVESLFHPVLSKSYSQIPLAFKVWFSGNSSFRCWTPRLRSLMWGSEPSLQWVDFCGVRDRKSTRLNSSH